MTDQFNSFKADPTHEKLGLLIVEAEVYLHARNPSDKADTIRGGVQFWVMIGRLRMEAFDSIAVPELNQPNVDKLEAVFEDHPMQISKKAMYCYVFNKNSFNEIKPFIK